MQHPIIIDSRGEIKNKYNISAIWKHIGYTFNRIFSTPLRVSKMIMSYQDFQDIQQWSENKS